MNKKIILVLFVIGFVYSCREDVLTTQQSNKNVVIQDAIVKNGRLYFPNKESLQATYNYLKGKKAEEINTYIDKKGISSLVPVITEANEKKVLSILKQRETRSLESVNITDEDILNDLEDLEDVVGDEAYTAMLNGNAEIQVANDIYKYTDVGLFITPADNYSNLENYLEVKNISQDLLTPTPVNSKTAFLSAQTASYQLETVDNNISYFMAPQNILPFDGEAGGGGTIYTPPPTEPTIDQIVNNLKIGQVRKPWLGNIFGTTWETDDQYESRRRVKVKFYSQNLWLVYAVGCKVKHQYRGWTGLWRKENADKLGIGVNAIKWTFNHSMNTTTATNGVPLQAYWTGSNLYTSNNGITFTFQKNQNIPDLPFAKHLDGVIQFVTNVSGLTDDQLNKLFWETAWKQTKKFLESENKKLGRVAFVVDSFNSTYIRYYDFSQIEDNQDCIERVFDWGIATPQFTYTFGGGVGNGMSITSYKFDFSRPTAVAVNMYGIAKKNGGWHGVKLDAK